MRNFPRYIDPSNDECFYRREYYPRRGFLFCETNQLIKNFKHNVKKRPDLEKHKISSINIFAEELSLFFAGKEAYYLSFVPPSKCKIDGLYDDRLEKTLLRLKELRNNIVIEQPVSLKKSRRASHMGGPRIIDEIIDNYQWDGFKNKKIRNLYIIDDIITTGSHYKAFKKIIMKYDLNIEVTGLFWAYAVLNRK